MVKVKALLMKTLVPKSPMVKCAPNIEDIDGHIANSVSTLIHYMCMLREICGIIMELGQKTRESINSWIKYGLQEEDEVFITRTMHLQDQTV